MYSFDSRIRYSEVDFKGNLTFEGLLNYFQDCSTFQSEDLGVGLAYMKEINLVWVLSSWQIVVKRYPALGEKIKIGTLPYEFKSFLGSRNFVMYDEAGEEIAIANSLWTLLDISTNKPALPTQPMLDKYIVEPKLEMEYAPRKIRFSKENHEELETITVRKHNLDTNMHVNNGQYVAIAMELLPEGFCVKQMRAEYKKQAFLNDVFYPKKMCEDGKVIISLENEEGEAYFVAEFIERTE